MVLTSSYLSILVPQISHLFRATPISHYVQAVPPLCETGNSSSIVKFFNLAFWRMQCVTEPDQGLNSRKNGQICRFAESKYQMPSLCLRTYILFPCKEESLVHKKSYYCKVVLSILVKFFIKIKVTITLDLCITTLCTYTTFLLLHGPHCSFLLIVKHQEHISWFSTNPTFTYFSLDINAFSFLILVFLYFLTVYFPKQH